MRIADRFAQPGPVFSFEFFPPRTPEAVEQLLATAAELKALRPAFVSVTYGAGGSTRRVTVDVVSRIKRDIGIEAMAHVTCVGHTKDELTEVLDTIEAGGIENVLALRGDPPRGQTTFVPTPGGFAHGQELTRFVKERYPFCIGGAASPEKHIEAPDAQTDLRHLKEKVDSGAEFLLTQLFFDPNDYFRFVERARAIGITVPIVPGIMPITNVAQIHRFTSMCGASVPEPLRERLDAVKDDDVAGVAPGVEWATEQCRRLLARGAPGLPFHTLNPSHSPPRVFDNLDGTGSLTRA